MLGKTTLFALVGAVAVSASEIHHLMTRSDNLFTRQITAANIPSACQSGCSSALTIYQACTSGDATTCLSVCQASNFASFTSCLQCIVNNTPGAGATDVSTLNQALQQLTTACNAAGSSVAATSIAVSSGASGAASGASAISQTGASAISSAGSPTSSSPRASTNPSSVVSGLGASISSGLAAASSSRAAGDVVADIPRGLGGLVLGAVGVVAGAALVL